MKQRPWDRYLAQVRREWASFFPNDGELAVCPICLARTEGRGDLQASEAHAVPKAVGGKLVTLLCKRCNETLGHRIDVWFGDYIRVVRAGHPFASKTRPRYLTIAGVRVGGDIRVGDSGDVEVFVHDHRSPPDAWKKIDRRLNAYDSRRNAILPSYLQEIVDRAAAGREEGRSISIPMPLNSKGAEVELGVLSMGYLLWFRYCGYSWVLQAHLESVRACLRGEVSIEAAAAVIGKWKDRRVKEPWVGLVQCGDLIWPAAGIVDLVVLFQPADAAEAKEELQTAPTRDIQIILEFPPNIRVAFGFPMGIVIGERMPVIADRCLTDPASARLLLFPPGETSPVWLDHSLSREEFEDVRTRFGSKVVEATGSPWVPINETRRRDT